MGQNAFEEFSSLSGDKNSDFCFLQTPKNYFFREKLFYLCTMYLAKTPTIVKPLMNQFVWHGSRFDKKIFITFDDGPIPELTPWVMNELKRFEAKASFFCVGDNVLKNPSLYKELIDEGHSTGNHTQSHINGWKNKEYGYVKNALLANKFIDSHLFRPPYGKIKRSQAESLNKRFSLIMWDVLSGDFDQKISPQKCLKNVTKNVSNGFHHCFS
jgi:peptidoglycan-N-acetylglucosamine deacetylase